MHKFAVISFPGTNCEAESVRAFKRHGMEAEMVLWNDPGMLDGSRLSEFDGYCIAGGFSYEDRGRSGIVAAQEPIMEVIKREADVGKIVLGICNGAQILVESGLIPGYDNKALGLSLTWNEMKQDNHILDTGYYNVWCHLKNTASKNRSAFNQFDGLLHVPIAHGEGRFVITDALLRQLEENDQILFKYCDPQGHIDLNFPVNPNGATAGIAALCNPAGNVMAIMPHPERDPEGSGQQIFNSIKAYLESDKKTSYHSLGKSEVASRVQKKQSYDAEIYVRLIITDNAERTIEEALSRKNFQLHLDRYEFFGVNFKPGVDLLESVRHILDSGELANFNKQLVYVTIGNKVYQYDPSKGFSEARLNLNQALIVMDEKDFVGQSKLEALQVHAGHLLRSLQFGVVWNVLNADQKTIEKVIDSKVLYNPYSMILYKA